MRECSVICALARATGALTKPHVDNPRLDAEVLLSWVLGVDRHYLYLDRDKQLKPEELEAYRKAVARRAAGTPLHYITGYREFMALEFAVSPAVLIPRPETEILVEHAAVFLNRRASRLRRAVDLGTGSGIIAVCLARMVEDVIVWAVDSSSAALDLAAKNARRLGVADKITFIEGDLFKPLERHLKPGFVVDVVVSNPPYIPTGDMPKLPTDVQAEPGRALDGGPDGLAFYRRIVPGAMPFLAEGGMLALEVGYGKADSVAGMLQECGYHDITVKKDYAGIERVVSGIVKA